MACLDRYAEAYEYAAFFCVGAIITGVEEVAGVAHVVLTDTTVDFLHAGVEAGVGMVAYNTTQSTQGYITAVTAHTITVAGVTWDLADAYRVAVINSLQRSTIEHYLNITASDISSALASVGACDCSWASWAAAFLSKINIIEAGAFHNCDCGDPQLSDEQQAMFIEWANARLEEIRLGKVDICDGATGSDFPARADAEQATTEFAAGEIILNVDRRENG